MCAVPVYEYSGLLLPLTDLERCSAPRAGVKAANLARLQSAGFPVPDGFVIGHEAARAIQGQARVWKSLERLRTTEAGGAAGDHEEIRLELSRAFMEAEMPEPLEQAILAAYRDLVGPGAPVAVRSSATAEDLEDASFAGLYETRLNVRSDADLLAALRQCWASRYSHRAMAYQARHEGDGGHGTQALESAMAVLVQRMAPAEMAGVLFTANPLNGRRDEMLINAAPGVGEELVSGRITPDQIRVDREGRILENVRSGEGPVLDDERIRELCRLATRIEQLFGAPQDIEWSFGDGTFHILQSRPITTLGARKKAIGWGHPTNEALARHDVVFWSNWNTRENMPYPLKPLAWTYFKDIMLPEMLRAQLGVDEQSPIGKYSFIMDQLDGRAYWNMSLALGHPFFRRFLPGVLRGVDHEAARTFARMTASGEFRPHRLPIRTRDLIGPACTAVRTVLGFPWFASPARLTRLSENFWARADAFEARPFDGQSIPQLIAEVRNFTRDGCAYTFPLFFVFSKSLVGFAVLYRLTRRWKDVRFGDLLDGLPGNKTIEATLEMYRVSRCPAAVQEIYRTVEGPDIESALRATPEGRAHLERLDVFLDAFGHRGTKDLDVGHPSWREDRSFVHQMIRSYQSLGADGADPLEQNQKAVRQRERTIAEYEKRLRAGVLSRLIPVRLWLFRRALRLMSEFFPWRENARFYGVRTFHGSRRVFLEIGRRLRDRGQLAAVDDVFFLTVPELLEQDRRPGEGEPPQPFHALVRQREAVWRSQIDREAPLVVRSDGKSCMDEPPALTGDRLKGFAASGGRVTGTARIIRDPGQSHRFTPGEILVAPYTEPGWAPLFLLARGLVMEVGGVICHGAIVARECGIPAVVGLRGATTAIRDGDRITVDGDRGEVILHGQDG